MESPGITERTIRFGDVVPDLVEPSSLDFRDTNVEVLKVSQENILDLHFALFSRGLNGRQLYDFFKKVASDRFDPGLRDVVVDLDFIFQRNTYAGRLRHIHENDPNLSEAWGIFVAHYKDLLNEVFGEALNSERAGPSKVILPRVKFFSRKGAQEYALRFIKKPSSDDHHLRSLFKKRILDSFGYDYEKEAQLMEEEFGKEYRNSRKTRERKRKKEVNSTRNKFVASVLQQTKSFSEEGVRDEVLREYIEKMVNARMDEQFNQREVILPNSNEKVVVFTKKSREEKDESPYSVPVSQFEDRGAQYVLARKTSEDFFYTLSKNFNPQDISQLPAVEPALAWQHNTATGERSLVTNPDDLESVLSPLNLDPRVLQALRRGCLLAGLGMIPYVSPKIRDAWAPREELKGGNYPQFMGPLQRAVWVIKEHKELAQAPLLEQLEKVVV